jgi:probable rRNA maturation factor
MNIEINNKTKSRISRPAIKNITAGFLRRQRLKNADVSIALVGDRTIRRLNKQYRGADRVTDVLAFPGEKDYLGEIIIDYAQIKRQAKAFSPSIRAELFFILIHGLLHLLGYEDDSGQGKETMRRLGEEFMGIGRGRRSAPGPKRG